MKTRSAIVGLVGMAACLFLSLHVDAQEPKTRPAKETATKKARSDKQAYLGVAVESLQPVLARQLPELKGRGVVVAHVVKDSPAQKANLQRYDVLVSYDNHQLYSPEQLVKLVQQDKPGRDVSLDLISSGKEKKVKVTLGEHQAAAPQAQQPTPTSSDRVPFKIMRPNESKAISESFDSMTLSRLDANRFKAENSFRDDKGKIEHKKFEGSRQEIHKAIEKQKDLPPAERDQLLRALDLKPRFFDFGIPPISFPRHGVLWDSDDLDHELFNYARNP